MFESEHSARIYDLKVMQGALPKSRKYSPSISLPPPTPIPQPTASSISSTQEIIKTLRQNYTLTELRGQLMTLLLSTFPAKTPAADIVKKIEATVTKTDKTMLLTSPMSSPRTPRTPKPNVDRNVVKFCVSLADVVKAQDQTSLGRQTRSSGQKIAKSGSKKRKAEESHEGSTTVASEHGKTLVILELMIRIG